MLQPGEQRRVQLRLDRRAFEYWDEKQRAWTVAPGAYRVEVGSSSRNIALCERRHSPLVADAEPTCFKQRYQAMPCNLVSEHVASSRRCRAKQEPSA